MMSSSDSSESSSEDEQIPSAQLNTPRRLGSLVPPGYRPGQNTPSVMGQLVPMDSDDSDSDSSASEEEEEEHYATPPDKAVASQPPPPEVVASADEAAKSKERTPLLVDSRLPPGWSRRVASRQPPKGGRTRYDVYIISPKGTQFRSPIQLARHLETTGEDLKMEQFDFSAFGMDLSVNKVKVALTPTERAFIFTETELKLPSAERNKIKVPNAQYEEIFANAINPSSTQEAAVVSTPKQEPDSDTDSDSASSEEDEDSIPENLQSNVSSSEPPVVKLQFSQVKVESSESESDSSESESESSEISMTPAPPVAQLTPATPPTVRANPSCLHKQKQTKAVKKEPQASCEAPAPLTPVLAPPTQAPAQASGSGVVKTDSSDMDTLERGLFAEDLADKEVWIISMPKQFPAGGLNGETVINNSTIPLRNLQAEDGSWELQAHEGSLPHMALVVPCRATGELQAVTCIRGVMCPMRMASTPPAIVPPPSKKAPQIPDGLKYRNTPFGAQGPKTSKKRKSDAGAVGAKRAKKEKPAPVQNPLAVPQPATCSIILPTEQDASLPVAPPPAQVEVPATNGIKPKSKKKKDKRDSQNQPTGLVVAMPSPGGPPVHLQPILAGGLSLKAHPPKSLDAGSSAPYPDPASSGSSLNTVAIHKVVGQSPRVQELGSKLGKKKKKKALYDFSAVPPILAERGEIVGAPVGILNSPRKVHPEGSVLTPKREETAQNPAPTEMKDSPPTPGTPSGDAPKKKKKRKTFDTALPTSPAPPTPTRVLPPPTPTPAPQPIGEADVAQPSPKRKKSKKEKKERTP